MSIHCCVMQGRIDALELLLKYDKENGSEIRKALDEEEATSPPSLVHLAVANDHIECAQWYVSNRHQTAVYLNSLRVVDVLFYSVRSAFIE